MSRFSTSVTQEAITEELVRKANLGEPNAFDSLIEHVAGRLCALTHKMLDRYPQVRRWEETDDVLQEALVRLHRALTEVKPDSVGRFFGLASTLVRRTLIDLSRHYYGVYGMGAKHKSAVMQGNSESGDMLDYFASMDPPDSLEAWTAFHHAIENLPQTEKEAFSLVWYGGLTQKQVSEVLKVSERTVIRRMNRARLCLNGLLAGQKPPSSR